MRERGWRGVRSVEEKAGAAQLLGLHSRCGMLLLLLLQTCTHLEPKK